MALEPIAALRKYVGEGRPIASVDLRWQPNGVVYGAQVDEGWFDRLPPIKRKDTYRWLRHIDHDCTYSFGKIVDINVHKQFVDILVKSEYLRLNWLEALFTKVDKDRWQYAAVLHRKDKIALDVVQVSKALHAPQSDVFSERRQRLRDRLTSIKRPGAEDAVARVLLIMEWSAITVNRIMPEVFATPEFDEDTGDETERVGLWWRNEKMDREVDLNQGPEGWYGVKTSQLERIRASRSIEEVESLVITEEVGENIEALVPLARWLVGMEELE